MRAAGSSRFGGGGQGEVHCLNLLLITAQAAVAKQLTPHPTQQATAPTTHPAPCGQPAAAQPVAPL
jgi:hypothetical protein